MRSQSARVAMVMATVFWVFACGESRAQYGSAYGTAYGGSAGSTAPNPGMLANPYTNPYMNPYLNPYMTQFQTTPGNAALYFFGAQAAMGGIGSGQLSGVRPGQRPVASRQPAERPADPSRTPPGVPSSISRYFGRSQPQPRAPIANYYNRQGRYFPLNRR